MGFNGIQWWFNGHLMGFNGDLIGFNGKMAVTWGTVAMDQWVYPALFVFQRVDLREILPSGKLTKKIYWNLPLMVDFSFKMMIFNSYVKLPEGTGNHNFPMKVIGFSCKLSLQPINWWETWCPETSVYRVKRNDGYSENFHFTMVD